MKKLSLILVLLLAVGLAAFAGEPSVSGTLGTQINFDDDGDIGNIGKLRVALAFPVGDYITVNMDLRNDAWASGTIADTTFTDSGTDTVDVGFDLPGYFYFNQVYATTDISGIFGIDAVALKLYTGNFEYWIANWNSPTSTNRARVVETFQIGGSDASPDMALDVGIGSFGTIAAYIETTAGSDTLGYKFGFILGPVVDGLNAALSYSGTDGISYMKVEAGYTLAFGDGMSLYIPVGFIYDLEGEAMTLGFGAKFSGFGLSLGAGAKLATNTADEIFFSVLDIQLAYAVMDSGLSIYVNAFGDPSDIADGGADDDFLQALDFGLSYDLAGNTMYVGYVAGLGDSDTTVPLMMDDSTGRHGITGSGFYIVNRINF